MGQFAELLAATRTVVLDGAGGTQLERRGYVDRLRLWSAGAMEDPDAYLQHAMGWRELGAAFVGGCCGTGPEHVRRLAGAFRSDARPHRV